MSDFDPMNPLAEERPMPPDQHETVWDSDAYPFMIKDEPPKPQDAIDGPQPYGVYPNERGPLTPQLRHKTLNDYAREVRDANDNWWRNPETGELLADEGNPRNKGMLIALIHSELSEMLEGVRRGKMDEHLLHRTSEEVELVDAFIRLMDYAGEYGFDLDAIYREKMAYNAQRADHKLANRRYEGGKAF